MLLITLQILDSLLQQNTISHASRDLVGLLLCYDGPLVMATVNFCPLGSCA